MKNLFLIIITIFLASTISFAQEFKLFRLSDKVGDTIDFIEREQYSLFPGIVNFESARILVKNDSNYYAEITSKENDSIARFFLKLTPRELERIIFCIENPDRIKNQIESDEYAKLALKRFWEEVESKRISTIEEKIQKPSTAEGKFIGTVTGTTIGSMIGGCTGSSLGIKQTTERKCWFEIIPIGEGGCCIGGYTRPTYKVEHLIFWSAAALGTSVGAFAGYKLGERGGRRNIIEPSTEIKSNNWTIGCAIASAVPGIATGIVLGLLLGGSRFARVDPDGIMENDPNDFTMIPGIIAGAGIAIDIIYVGYRIGRSIDRKKAIQAAKEKENKK